MPLSDAALRAKLYPVVVNFVRILTPKIGGAAIEFRDSLRHVNRRAAQSWIDGVKGHSTIRDAHIA